MKFIIKNIACQVLIILLVVQTLNLSINSLDFYTNSTISNSLDEQDYVDSMIEFVVENVMGYAKDTFHDKANVDNFSKQQQNIPHFDLKWFQNSSIIADLVVIQKEFVHFIPKNEALINLYYKEVPAKPPQVIMA
jgi:hypothetical protein